jgi:hypothetical protein
MFHIHIDAHNLSEPFEEFLLNVIGFTRTNFSGHSDEAVHYETPIHLTKKTHSSKDFREIFDATIAFAKDNDNALTGYIEGEYIPTDIDILSKPYDPSVPFPIQLELKSLAPNTFREDEIHITLDRDKSDVRLLQAFRNAGFFSAFMDKSTGNVEIFTVQGTYQQIQDTLPLILNYLYTAGGAVNCSVKEERIIKWWISSLTVQPPPVISKVITVAHSETSRDVEVCKAQ